MLRTAPRTPVNVSIFAFCLQGGCRRGRAAHRGEQIPALKGNIAINNIGTVIGSHTCPGTVALFFMGDKRVD